MSELRWCLLLVAFLGVAVFGDDTIGQSLESEVFDASIHRTRSLPEHDDLEEESRARNWTSISDLLDIYSSKNLVLNWRENEFPIGDECERDITRYVQALKNHEMWALKGTK